MTLNDGGQGVVTYRQRKVNMALMKQALFCILRFTIY